MTDTVTTEEGSSAADSGWLPDRAIQPGRSLWRHRWLALGLGILIAALGVPVAWSLGKPAYLAEAAVRVSRTFAKNLKEDDETRFNSNSDYRQFVQHQVREITSYRVAMATLERLPTAPPQWAAEGESRRRAAERLMAALRVRAVPDTYLITVGLEGEDPRGLDELVNAVTAAYLEIQKQDEIYNPELRVGQLNRRREEILREMHAAAATQSDLGQELGVTSFSDGFRNPYDAILNSGTEALAAARRRRIGAEARLRALEEHFERALSLEVDSAAQRLIAGDRSLGDVKNFLMKRRSEIVLEVGSLTERHPGRAPLDRELETIDSELSSLTGGTLEEFRAMLLQERSTEAAGELSKARAELAEATRVEADLEVEVNSHSEKVSWFSKRYHQALDLQRTIVRDRDRLETIEDRIQFFELESEAPGFVRLASAARPPEIPIRGGRRKLLGVVLVLALIVALCVPILIDRLDPRLHTPEEARRLFGFAPAGWLPELGTPVAARIGAAQLRRLALTIDRDRRANGTRVLVFSGAAPGGGTTTLVLDLARELGHLGMRALAVEANPLSSDERYGGRDGVAGLAAILGGESDLAAALVPASEDLPERLPLLAASADFRFPSADALRRVFDEAGGDFDVLLIDAAPARLVPDTELLARSADASVLVVEATATHRGEICAAARELEKIAPSAFGVVVNRVRLEGKSPYAAELLGKGDAAQPIVSWSGADWLWSST